MKRNKTVKNRKSGKISTIVLVAVFFVGLSVLLYPTISDFQNSKKQSRAIVDYDKIAADLTPEDYSDFFEKAEVYNHKIRQMSFPFLNHTSIADEYYNTLDVNGNGIMGYITIDKIKVQLPIYHGTDAKVLNSAVGHVEGSTLPIGGENSHTVLSAHRGLPSAKLFTNLDKMEIGDVFTLHVLDQVYTYQIDQILIVLPEETDPLGIQQGEDLCTLVTCTPYGINSHRMLVRGVRIENIEPDKVVSVVTEAYQVDPLIVMPAVAVPFLGLFLVVLLVKSGKERKEQKQKREVTVEVPVETSAVEEEQPKQEE